MSHQIFHFGGCLVQKGQYIWSSYNNIKYFTLGGTEWRYWLMDIEKYVVGSSPPDGASFAVPTTSIAPRAAPLISSLVPSLQIEWGEVGGYADQWVFLGVHISCGGKFWSAHYLSQDKAPSPHSQVAPLTPKALSAGRTKWISRCAFWCPHYMSGQVSVHPQLLIG